MMPPQNDPSEWLFLAATISSMVVAFFPNLLKFHKNPELPISIEERTVISSKDSLYHARIKPKYSILVAIVIMFFVSVMIIKYNNQLLALVTSLACVLAICVPLLDMKIKEVAVSDNGLCVSNFIHTIMVPFHEIKVVKAGNSRATAGYVTVVFTNKTTFGRKIYFRPVDICHVKKILEPYGLKLEGLFKSC